MHPTDDRPPTPTNPTSAHQPEDTDSASPIIRWFALDFCGDAHSEALSSDGWRWRAASFLLSSLFVCLIEAVYKATVVAETVLPALQAPESSVPAAMAVAAAATASVTASVTARGRRRDEVRCAAEVGAAHVIPTAAFARPMNLLIVDNDAMVRLTMATLLQQCGYNVRPRRMAAKGSR